MLQQYPDICAIIDFWDGDATGTAAAIRDAGKQEQGRSWLPPAAVRKSIAITLENGTFGAVVMTELHQPVRRHQRHHQVPAAERPAAGTSTTYIYTLEKATTKADLEARAPAGT